MRLKCFKKIVLGWLLLLLCGQTYGQEAEAVVTRPKIGVALGGGGALAYTHIGILKVLEEYHIPVDIITGTSMGSIVGALYALGYSATDLEHILRDEIDVMALFDDTLNRRYLGMMDKTYNYTSQIQLKFDKNGLESLNGLSDALAVEDVLDYYFWSAGGYANFNDFPRPFACVATNLMDGQPVVFSEGNLGEAVRASMAFPAIFTPVMRDGMMLVDGGLVRNLPVEDAIALGADYVIAIDLPKSIPISDAKTSVFRGLFKFFLQSSVESIEYQRTLADVVIRPNVTNYELFSFDKAQELIDLGEATARAMLDELLPYAVSAEDYPKIDYGVTDEVYIEAVEVKGTAVPELVKAYFNFDTPTQVTRQEIRYRANLLRYSSYFKYARYYYDGTKLIVDVEEATPIKIGFNFGYTSDFGLNAGFGLGLVVVKPWMFYLQSNLNYLNGLASAGYLALGYHRFNFMQLYGKWLVSDGLQTVYRPADSFIIPQRRLFNQYKGNLGLAFTFASAIYLEMGFELGYWSADGVHNALTTAFPTARGSTYSSVTLRYVVDTLNNKFYPQEGLFMAIDVNAGTNNFENRDPFVRFNGQMRLAVPLNSNFSFEFGSEGGFLMANNEAPLPLYFQLGGISSIDQHTKLPGMRLGAVYGQSLWGFEAKAMYTFISRFHAIASWNGALVAPTTTLQFNAEHFHESAGLKLVADLAIFRLEQGFFWVIERKTFQTTLVISTEY